MTLLVLVILAVIWAAVLLPPYLQNRSENRPADSISTFRSQLQVLERRSTMAAPSAHGAIYRAVNPQNQVPAGYRADRARLARAEAKRRRRDIFVTLLIAAGLTLALGILFHLVLLVHLVIDALLAGYVALLVRTQRIEAERTAKVRYLEPRRAAHAPAQAAYRGPELALRRSAN